MKKLLLPMFMLITFVSMAQKHNPIEPMKCGHLHQHDQQSQKTSYLLNNYDVTCYFLDIEVTTSSAAIKGSNTIFATSEENDLNNFLFELNENIVIDSILVNNAIESYTRSGYEVSVELSDPISASTAFQVKIYYDRPASLTTDGIYNYDVNGWDKKVTYTLSEPYHAREWFPCKQDLHDKADSVYVFVTMDTSLKAGSNGLLTNITPIGSNKHRYEWKSYYPIAYYLISIAVAEYEEYNLYAKPEEIAGDSILVQNYLYRNFSDNDWIKDEFDATDELIELFSEKYSLYPFWQEKYGHSFVPLGGAMEHQTMTSTGTSTFYINAHELGHQWFGDNVTCATWQDIWINEGFASYSEYLAYEFLYSEDIAHEHLLNAQGYARQSPTGSVYIPFNEVHDEGRIFSWYLTYRKGLCLVHMIRSEINDDEKFFSLLQGFQTTFTDSVATGDDLMYYLNDNSEVDFQNFFDEWYYGEGYPRYTITWQRYHEKLRFIVNQLTTTENTPFFTTSIPLVVNADGAEIDVRLNPSQNADTIFMDYMFDSIASDVVFELDPKSRILKSNASSIIQGEDIIDTTTTSIIKTEISLACYPNPIITQLNVESKGQNIENIMIFDIKGQLVYDANPYNQQILINTQSWAKGSYVIKVQGTNEIKNFKIVKQ